MYETEARNTAGAALGRGTYSTGPSEIAPPVGRVTEAEQETRKLLESMQQALSHLEQRIAPILQPASPTGVGSSEKANREPSPFAGALLTNNRKLYELIGYVQDLSARVDF